MGQVCCLWTGLLSEGREGGAGLLSMDRFAV